MQIDYKTLLIQKIYKNSLYFISHYSFSWQLQWCQLSRFWRETYVFLPRLPLSRFGT